MNASIIPTACSLSLTAVLAAGISHWWSVHQFTNLIESGVPVNSIATNSPDADPQTNRSALAAKPSRKKSAIQNYAVSSSEEQKEFFSALVEKMNRVESQNRDLLDQIAETNRDMMKMQFRLDTHSESFRPLPVSEERPFSSIDSGSGIDNNLGVLPPRAEPIMLPSYE